MKFFAFILFFALSFTAFSANKVAETPLEVLDNLETTEIKIELNTNNSKENDVAFECYYTVKWLYIDSPFIKKLDALA